MEPHLEMNVSATSSANSQVQNATYHFESLHDSVNMLYFVVTALLGRGTWYVEHL
jgi:hypothetical protein